jgi:hypothetical protein
MRGDEVIHGGNRIRCYDNGKGWDRFTVVYLDRPELLVNTFMSVGMSGHSTARLGKHLGKRIPFIALPDSLQRVVWNDFAA